MLLPPLPAGPGPQARLRMTGGEDTPTWLEPAQLCLWSAPQEDVPPRLCTSPIPWGGLSGFPSNPLHGTATEPEGLVIVGSASAGRKKRRRRRKPRRKEDAVAADSSSEELETGTESELSPLDKPRPEPPGCVRTRGGWGGGDTNLGFKCFLPLLVLCGSG